MRATTTNPQLDTPVANPFGNVPPSSATVNTQPSAQPNTQFAPQPPAPPAPTTPPASEPPANPVERSKKKSWIALVALALGALLLLAGGAFGYAVSYREFSIGQPKLERAVSHFVQSIPLLPKTPRFLIEQNALAHTKVTKQNFTVSVAAQSDDLASSLGMNQLDAQIVGKVDYTDPNNVIGELSLDITKEFRVEARKPNHMVYFKVAKVPSFVYMFLGAEMQEQLQPMLNNWISYDTSPLETEAREILNEERAEAIASSESEYEAIANSPLYKQFLAETEVSKSEIDGTPVFVLRTEPSRELIDMAYEKVREEAIERENSPSGTLMYEQDSYTLSDLIQELSVEVWVDASTYLTRKLRMSFVVYPENAGASATGSSAELFQAEQPARFVIAASMDGYEDSVLVEIPEESITTEEFLMLLSSMMYGSAASPSMQDDAVFEDEYSSYYSQPNFGNLQNYY